MPKISDIFGGEKLSYEEFMTKATEAGGEFGDIGEMRAAHTAEINRLRVAGAVEKEAILSGAKNSELLMRVLDMNGITVDNDGVHGIAEQIGRLRESDPYLFGGDAGGDGGVSSAKGGTVGTVGAVSRGMTISTGAPHSREAVDPDLLSDADYYASRMK